MAMEYVELSIVKDFLTKVFDVVFIGNDFTIKEYTELFTGNDLPSEEYIELPIGNGFVRKEYAELFIGNALASNDYVELFIGNYLASMDYIELPIGNCFVSKDYIEHFIGNGFVGNDNVELFIDNDYAERKCDHVIIRIAESDMEDLLHTIKVHRDCIAINLGLTKQPHCEISINDDEEHILDVTVEGPQIIKAIRDEVRFDVGNFDLDDLVQVVSCFNLDNVSREYLDLV